MTDHPAEWYCGARKKPERGGGTCPNRAGAGTDHLGVGRCKWHGGASPNAQRAGLAAVTERNFEEYLAKRGVPSSGDPVMTMTRLLDRVVAWHDYVEMLVSKLNVEDWEKRSRTEEGAVTIQLSVYVGLLERAQDRAHKHVSDFLRLGLEERLVRVSELQGRAIAAVLVGALEDLDLGDRAEDAKAAVGRRLELVAGGKPVPA